MQDYIEDLMDVPAFVYAPLLCEEDVELYADDYGDDLDEISSL